MFDSLVSAAAGTSGASAVDAWTRVESAACARRVAAMVTILDTAHAASGSASRDQWCIDNWDAVVAHIGATQSLTPGTASTMLLVGVSLQERFPKVAAAFLAGLITYPLVRAITLRAALVTDPGALRALDAALAEAFGSWAAMSADRLNKTVDALVTEVDPQAVRRTQTKARSRSIDVTVDDGSGLATLFGSLFATDASALDDRLDAYAATVCLADPRTKDQRRADAMGALAHGSDRLACLCESEDCPAHENPPSTGVVVYVIAHRDTIDERPTPPPPVPDAPVPNSPVADDVRKDDGDTENTDDAAAGNQANECTALDGEPPAMFRKPLQDLTLTEALTPTPGRLASLRPAALMGGQFLPGAIACRASEGATITAIIHPGQAPPEPRYRPSKKLADFVRCRDMTCRFPGCRVLATNCDVDHSIPWPSGPTAASNLKCLCRRHHLLKTFWGGESGWRERQLDDGTVLWTAPDGRTHATTPGSRLLFPELSEPTAKVVTAETPVSHTAGLTMPRRKTTRAEDRARRVQRERESNAQWN